MSYRTLFAAVLVATALGGCASRAELVELRAEVDELARSSTAADALRIARETRAELDATRAAAERAEREAAATRRMLEALDARMGESLGGSGLK